MENWCVVILYNILINIIKEITPPPTQFRDYFPDVSPVDDEYDDIDDEDPNNNGDEDYEEEQESESS